MSKLNSSIGQAHTCCGLGAKLKVGRGPAPPGDSDTADTDYRYYTLDSVETRAAAFNDTMTTEVSMCSPVRRVHAMPRSKRGIPPFTFCCHPLHI